MKNYRVYCGGMYFVKSISAKNFYSALKKAEIMLDNYNKKEEIEHRKKYSWKYTKANLTGLIQI
jgi:hypothetical protein